eukprot:CAMPEP_0116932398 /NCGR_PEP_ID=MMETSP0467-20121206/28407_1 /TAXON_ID=283647 /ORGANISM="Mesodinium pulex, Strain SPMC105" /LENGTH=85 /DNA_ID=CAMNT_0004613059 /DNA_START=143 /DNA_END=400 /DNA_ORIENTATION=-
MNATNKNKVAINWNKELLKKTLSEQLDNQGVNLVFTQCAFNEVTQMSKTPDLKWKVKNAHLLSKDLTKTKCGCGKDSNPVECIYN